MWWNSKYGKIMGTLSPIKSLLYPVKCILYEFSSIFFSSVKRNEMSDSFGSDFFSLCVEKKTFSVHYTNFDIKITLNELKWFTLIYKIQTHQSFTLLPPPLFLLLCICMWTSKQNIMQLLHNFHFQSEIQLNILWHWCTHTKT